MKISKNNDQDNTGYDPSPSQPSSQPSQPPSQPPATPPSQPPATPPSQPPATPPSQPPATPPSQPVVSMIRLPSIPDATTSNSGYSPVNIPAISNSGYSPVNIPAISSQTFSTNGTFNLNKIVIPNIMTKFGLQLSDVPTKLDSFISSIALFNTNTNSVQFTFSPSNLKYSSMQPDTKTISYDIGGIIPVGTYILQAVITYPNPQVLTLTNGNIPAFYFIGNYIGN